MQSLKVRQLAVSAEGQRSQGSEHRLHGWKLWLFLRRKSLPFRIAGKMWNGEDAGYGGRNESTVDFSVAQDLPTCKE